ncbi:tankyrase-1-like protein [Lates japonicus]|uniref:Tankyrase-1-like protein n=1 Tax=Lates japonicus TaxID=270547 RepID=A0AAD3RMK7_LATJO|nr:tankyrase-1-like protein [Lates japonicus]
MDRGRARVSPPLVAQTMNVLWSLPATHRHGNRSQRGEYKKDELLEAARSGSEEKLMALLTPLNVSCHASDGRKHRLMRPQGVLSLGVELCCVAAVCLA